MSSTTNDPGRIERELDQTRARLDGHLSELQQLSPGQLLDDVMRYFRGPEGAEFGRNLVQSVRGNPLPAAITGIGLTWLMASNPRPGAVPGQAAAAGTHSFNAGGYSAMTARIQSAEQGVVRRHDEAEHDYGVRLDDARGQALGLSRHQEDTSDSFSQRIAHALGAARQAVAGQAGVLRDGASSAAGSLGSLASGLGQGIGQGVGDAAQRVGGAVTQGSHAAGQAGGSLVSALTESPVLLGALGLAAGALLGALVPQSEREEAALGQIAGQARDSARSLAQTAVDGGAHVAQAVLDKGRDSAQAHGLAGGASPGQMVDDALSGNLSGQAKQVAEELLDAGENAIRKELGQPAEDKSAEGKSTEGKSAEPEPAGPKPSGS